jgi:microcystin degradation protein MlrC
VRTPKLPRLGRGGRPLRIAYGRIFHEANTFSPLVTGREGFTGFHHLVGEELAEAATLRGSELKGYLPHAELTGFRQAARLAGGVDTVPLSSSLAVPSGPLSLDAFQWVLDGLIERIVAAGELDGIYLALHGSMEVKGLEEAPEAMILRRVREAAPRARIAVSYDLHANLSAGLVDPVDVLIAYRTNPHWDLAPTGFRAGNRLIRALRGECRPVHAWRKLPIVLGGGTTIDFLDPMRRIFRAMKEMESDPRVLSASLFMVHPYTNAEDLGWATHVSTDGDQALADTLADTLAERAWSVRKEELPPMRQVDEALDEVRDGRWRRLGPVTLVDVDDIVGAGAPGGNTRFLEALARDDRGLTSYVTLHDPRLIDELWDAQVGETMPITLRGTPGYEQPPVEVEATIAARRKTDFGRTIRLDSGGIRVIAAERPPMPVHPKLFREMGLSHRDADVIVQKNFFHYRLFYVTSSFRHLPVVTDGATSLTRVRERDYRVPTWPGRDPSDWRSADRILRGGFSRATANIVRA